MPLARGYRGRCTSPTTLASTRRQRYMELEGDRNEKKQRNAFLNELQHMRRLESAH
ncbi:unnamed protein product, partial [Ascophyllum nodosum]